MSNLEHPTVWQIMAAVASDEYELREVAFGEFEIGAIAQDVEVEMSHVTSAAKPSAEVETAISR